jgi:hypothetical protein
VRTGPASIALGVVAIGFALLAALFAFEALLTFHETPLSDGGLPAAGVALEFLGGTIWLFYEAIVIFSQTPPGPKMKIVGTIALVTAAFGFLANARGFFVPEYAAERQIAVPYFEFAVAAAFVGVGHMLDNGKAERPLLPYVVGALIVVQVMLGVARSYLQAHFGLF